MVEIARFRNMRLLHRRCISVNDKQLEGDSQ